MFLAFGITSACWRAQRTGRGQFVDVAMVDGVLSCSERIVYQYAINGTSPQPEGSHHPLFCPFGMFPASDGWVTVGCPNELFWITLCELMGRQDVLQDTRLRTNDGRMKHAAEVKKIVSAFTGVRTKAQLTAVFAVRLPYGPVYSAGDIFKDPHFATRQMLVEVEQPNSVHKLTIAGVPVKMSKTPGGVRTRAPKLGEHTRSVLMAEGLDAAAIDRLMSQGAIFCEQ
jgi:formyl-CoA transferase